MDPLDYGSYTFLKNGTFSDSFSLFLSIQYSLQKTKVQYKFGRWLDLNHGPLVSEATALLTDPQPLPRLLLLEKFVRCFAFKFTLNFSVSKDAKKLLSRRDVFVAKFTHYKLFSRLLFDYFSGKTERTNRPIWSDDTALAREIQNQNSEKIWIFLRANFSVWKVAPEKIGLL